MIVCSAIPHDKVAELAPAIAGYLIGVEPYTEGRYLAEDMVVACIEKRMQLWIAFEEETKFIKGVVITNISNYARKSTITICFSGGTDLEAWYTDLLGMIETYAHAMDVDILEVAGRPGWKKFLVEKSGFKDSIRLYTKVLK